MIFILLNLFFNILLWFYLSSLIGTYYAYFLIFLVKVTQFYYGKKLYDKIYPLAERQLIFLEEFDTKMKLETGKLIFKQIQKYIFPLMLSMDIPQNTDQIKEDKYKSSVFETKDEEVQFLNNLLDSL